MSNIIYWIWFSQLRGLRYKTRRALLEEFDGPDEIYFADKARLRSVQDLLPEEIESILNKDLEAAETIYHRCGEEDVSILTFQDAAYPQRLRNISDPPAVLYYKGRMPSVDTEPVIAMVGTRKCTPYAYKMARTMAYEVASGGGIVVTGLAEGVDSRCAEGALMAGAPVIGVLGTAINEVYPRFNDRLFQDVQATGVIISEYPPDFKGSRETFPRRNRIIAGLALGTVIIEAPLRSGALITAHRALDYGRDVFAVPANADSPNGKGSNQLIKEGAALVECGWDVLKEYESRFPDKIQEEEKKDLSQVAQAPALGEKEEKPKKAFLKLRVAVPRKKPDEKPENKLAQQLETLTDNQLKIISVIDHPSMHVDDIIDMSRLPAASVLAELTILQIKGYVRQEQGKRFTLNITK